MKIPTRSIHLVIPGLALVVCGFAVPALAHQLNEVSGGHPTHLHVYKRTGFGKNLTTGHYARPAGSRGIVIWSASPERAFTRPLPGFQVPQGHAPQVSQKQLYRQPPVFTKQAQNPPQFGRK